MRELIISNLDGVTRDMIDALELWLQDVQMGKIKAGKACPFKEYVRIEQNISCESLCMILFDNKPHRCKAYCPCFDYNFGEKASILAFTIICDIWKVYYKNNN